MSIKVRYSGFDGYDRLWGRIEHNHEYADQWIFWGNINGQLQFRRCPDDAIFRKNCVKKARKYNHPGRPVDAVVESFEEVLIIRKLKHGN